MAGTKHKQAQMTPFQEINHLLRKNAATNEIVAICRKLMLEQLDLDITYGPGIPHIADFKVALWAMATKLHELNRENDTLKRKFRRDTRKSGGKPQPELLKKEPEQPAQAT